MLRDKNLVPLSHQHQHALAMCVRIERGLNQGERTLESWQTEIEQQFEGEIRFHFEAEETILFPAAAGYEALRTLVEELSGEHTLLRDYWTRARQRRLTNDDVRRFGELLAGHVRKEESQLFEVCQQVMPAQELQRLGAAVDDYFRSQGVSPNACPLPRQT